MGWLTYALLATFAKAGQHFTEKGNQKTHGTMVTTFFVVLFATLAILPVVLFTKQLPQVNSGFWLGVLGSASFYLIAKPLRVFAIGNGDLSEIIPMVSFGALFSLVYAWLILGETPSVWGFIGVLLISGGGYLLHIDRATFSPKTLLAPVKKVFTNKVHILLFISLLTGSLLGVFDKYAISNTTPSSPQFVYMTENLLVLPVFALTIFVRRKGANFLSGITNWKPLIAMGVLAATAEGLNFSALSLGNVGYVNAIKQLTALIVVLGGVFYLHEGKLKQRLISASVMATGAFLVAYLG